MKITRPEQVKVGQVWEWLGLDPIHYGYPNEKLVIVISEFELEWTKHFKVINKRASAKFLNDAIDWETSMSWNDIEDGLWKLVKKRKCEICCNIL